MISDPKWPPGLLDKVREARHIVVFTGAGVSKASGIPTFRDKSNGHWQKFDAQQFCTAAGFRRNPDLVWRWYERLRLNVQAARPNAAHLAISRFAKFVPAVSVITQNVDDLHERAGSTGVIHLHGSVFAPRCSACSRPHELPQDEPPISFIESITAPICGCGGKIRPGAVWFGEDLNRDEFANAFATVNDCDVFLSVGTSMDVYPAAGLPFHAANRHACVIQINPTKTDLNHRATFNLRGMAETILPDILYAIWDDRINHD